MRAPQSVVDAGLRPFYFTAVFWGPVYRDYFTDLLLASLLSPNNIPALNPRRGNKFLIATPRADWDALQEHPLFVRLRAYAEPEWLKLEVDPDDHKMDRKMRAMSRGHQLVASRAFEDRAYGVFVTPDVVLSDGSVAAMERLAEAGTKVVLAVAIRYQHEPILAELEQEGYVKPGQPIAIGSRDLMRIALRHLHSETLRYEYDAPWFALSPISVYWQVPGGDGMIIHSFSWAPVVVDYGALSRHDTETFEHWTLDGDYIYRNFPAPSDIYVVTDSDEIAYVSFTKESDLHFELRPYLAGRARWITDWYKTSLIRALKDSSVMDPLKRHIFPTPVYLHSGEISPVWAQVRSETARTIARACGPDGRRDRMTATVAGLFALDLCLSLGHAAGDGRMIYWYWRHRRFVWRRVKEKVGLVRGRSRVDDGRDWASPALGLMHPIWSLRVVLGWGWRRSRRSLRAVLGWGWRRSRRSLRAVLGWGWRRCRRLLGQRGKETVEPVRGRPRMDDGRDWVSPAFGPMHPIWSLRVILRQRLPGASRSTRVSPKAVDADADTKNGYPPQ